MHNTGSREHPGTHQPVTPHTLVNSLSFRSSARLAEGDRSQPSSALLFPQPRHKSCPSADWRCCTHPSQWKKWFSLQLIHVDKNLILIVFVVKKILKQSILIIHILLIEKFLLLSHLTPLKKLFGNFISPQKISLQKNCALVRGRRSHQAFGLGRNGGRQIPSIKRKGRKHLKVSKEGKQLPACRIYSACNSYKPSYPECQKATLNVFQSTRGKCTVGNHTV